MVEPVRTTDTPAAEKIAVPRRALEKLIKELFMARDKGWQVDLKPEYGLPKMLVMVIDKLLTGVREQLTGKDVQITALSHANVRVLFLAEALTRLNEIDEGDLQTAARRRQSYSTALSDIMSAAGAGLGVLLFVGNHGDITELYWRGFAEQAEPAPADYAQVAELMCKVFSNNDDKSLIVNESDPNAWLSTLVLPAGHPPIRNILLLPLRFSSNNQVRGLLYVANKLESQSFDESDLMVLDLFLNEIGNVRGRMLLTRQLRREKDEQKRLLEEIKHAQEQLLQAEKMASVGQLAAGVAHEINNPVGYINSNIGTLQKYINDIFGLIENYQALEMFLPEDKRSDIAKIRAAADLEFLRQDTGDLVRESIEGVTRVKQIVNDLKNFSRVDEAEWSWADLHQGIDSTLNIAQNEIKYKADVVKNYGELPTVWCIASQINQVVLNILVNAAQAIKEHGSITITTQREGTERVQIKIADTGCGIPAETIRRIFDPFYTSKAVGEGTGLGLSLSYGIIEKHHGKIDVASEVGKGTVFTITLPVKQPEAKIGVQADGAAKK